MRTRLTVIVILFLATIFGHPVTAAAQDDGVKGFHQSRPFTLNGLLSDPADDATRGIIWHIQQPLFTWSDDQPVAALAQLPPDRVEESPIYIFHLNEHAKWQDNNDFTAYDVVFTLDSVRALGTERSPYAQRVNDAVDFTVPVADGVYGYNAPDPHTFVIASKLATDNDLFYAITIPIIPKHIWETIAIEQWANDPGSTGMESTNVVGSGEFQFVSIHPLAPCDDTSEDRELQPDLEVDVTTNDTTVPFYLYTCTIAGLKPEDRYALALEAKIVIKPAEVGGAGIPPGVLDWMLVAQPNNEVQPNVITVEQPTVNVNVVSVDAVDPNVVDPSVLEQIEEEEAAQ